MLNELLADVRVVLGSKSPRRKELLAKLGVNFEIIVKETSEAYNDRQTPEKIVKSIALDKLKAFEGKEFDNALVITADTIVVCEEQVLGKPKEQQEAFAMLHLLQGRRHEVMTAVALRYQGEVHAIVEKTTVAFASLRAEEINFYIEQYHPYDKAGAYGIQEWIGLIGVKGIVGSYENVVGLPTARLYKLLREIVT